MNPLSHSCKDGGNYIEGIHKNFLRMKRLTSLSIILFLELHYDLRKKLFFTFNDMMESSFQIEDVLVKQCEITLNK